VIYFRIRVTRFGIQPFRVTAIGERLSDAIQRTVRVFPNGKELSFTQSDRLTMGSTEVPVSFPDAAIPGTQALTLKIYPGIASQIVEGLESILRMPSGCFEQTSSAAYPNVLVLDYLRETGQLSPEIQFQAAQYINTGYQRLTTFEVPGGGFSLFGNPPSDRMLTAYGLMEFNDMSRVHNVDEEILRRTAAWLLSQQEEDGSWDSDRGFFHEPAWQDLSGRLPSTAHILWALADAGYMQDPGAQRGLEFLTEHQARANSPYVLGLIANALVAADLDRDAEISPRTDAVLNRLAATTSWEGDEATWFSGTSTYMGSYGPVADIESTALATHAFLRADRHLDLASAGLTTLIRQKDSYGTWYSTQATVMALKALRESLGSHVSEADAVVTVSLNNSQSHLLRITPENSDVVQWIIFDDFQAGSTNTLTINASGDGNLLYQISGSYYLPWSESRGGAGGTTDIVTIDLSYDRTSLQVEDTITVDATISMNTEGSRAEWAIIDLGLPPGFRVLTPDLDALIEQTRQPSDQESKPTIERYELTGRQIILYISQLSYEMPLTFRYRLQAKYPLVAQAPASAVYDYYNPEVGGESAPILIVVDGPLE
jgi:uncharacterized protein YfaS (alpha-2-macroglobulin family)